VISMKIKINENNGGVNMAIIGVMKSAAAAWLATKAGGGAAKSHARKRFKSAKMAKTGWLAAAAVCGWRAIDGAKRLWRQ